tara:strand:+ start:620 stop:925 length:306 start_codon:yes stop_codon:yes gene_type:complete
MNSEVGWNVEKRNINLPNRCDVLNKLLPAVRLLTTVTMCKEMERTSRNIFSLSLCMHGTQTGGEISCITSYVGFQAEPPVTTFVVNTVTRSVSSAMPNLFD